MSLQLLTKKMLRIGLRAKRMRAPMGLYRYSNIAEVKDKKPKPETEFEKALEEAKLDSLIAKENTIPIVKKKPLWDRVKEEVLHYWHGSKLLAAETSISSRLLWKLLKGQD